MSRRETLLINLAYQINDSKVLGSNTDITSETEDGNRFSAARRLAALNYAKNQLDAFSRLNIATAIQNQLSFQSPFRNATYYLTSEESGERKLDVQQILRLDDLTGQGRRFRQVLNDVIDEYKTVGFTTRDTYPDVVTTITATIPNNGVPTATAFDYRAFVREVISISASGAPTVKYAKLSSKSYNDAVQAIRSASIDEELKEYIGVYSASGNFTNGVFVPAQVNFNPTRVHETIFFRSETVPVTEFIKTTIDNVRDMQNSVYSQKVFDELAGMVRFHKVEGVIASGEFYANDPNFDFKFVKEVASLEGNFKAISATYEATDDLLHGLRPPFATAFGAAFGQYTTKGDITNGVLTFRDENMQYQSHVLDVTGIKLQPFYSEGGEKFRKITMPQLREYQNGTAVLQTPNAMPDGRTDDYLFATNDTGAHFYPVNLTASGVDVEYVGLPPSKVFGFKNGSLIVFPDNPNPTPATLAYFGFSPNTVFYSESLSDEIRYNVQPKNYTGAVTVTYRGLPINIEFFTADADRIRYTGAVQPTELTYGGKPPAYLYSLRDGNVETFPDLKLSFLASGVGTEIQAIVQRAHPDLALNGQDLEYPPELDAVLLDFSKSYLYGENGDVELEQALEARARAKLAEWIGVANVAVGGRVAKGGGDGAQ